MVDSVSMYSGLVTCEAVGKRLGKLLLFDRLLYWPHTAWEHWRTKPSLHYILTESTISSLWHSNDPTCTCRSSTCTNYSQQLQDEAKKQVSHSCIDWSSSHASQSHMIPYEAHVFVTIWMIRTLLHTGYTHRLSHMRRMYLLPYAWSALYTLDTHTVRLVIFARDLLLHFPQVKTQFRPRNSRCPRVKWTNHVSIHPTWNYLSSCQIEACQQVSLRYCWSHPGNQSAR